MLVVGLGLFPALCSLRSLGRSGHGLVLDSLALIYSRGL